MKYDHKHDGAPKDEGKINGNNIIDSKNDNETAQAGLIVNTLVSQSAMCAL